MVTKSKFNAFFEDGTRKFGIFYLSESDLKNLMKAYLAGDLVRNKNSGIEILNYRGRKPAEKPTSIMNGEFEIFQLDSKEEEEQISDRGRQIITRIAHNKSTGLEICSSCCAAFMHEYPLATYWKINGELHPLCDVCWYMINPNLIGFLKRFNLVYREEVHGDDFEMDEILRLQTCSA
tara:strand:- start:801 stop:1334 length:534 start_codon:yes stop_codon:yes gene_type:complete